MLVVFINSQRLQGGVSGNLENIIAFLNLFILVRTVHFSIILLSTHKCLVLTCTLMEREPLYSHVS